MSTSIKIPAFGNTRNVLCNGHPHQLHFGSRDMRIVLILSLIHFISCSELIKEPTGVFYVLNNEPGLSIQINGLPHTALKFYKPGLDHFEPSYRSYITGQDFKIVILKESKRVFEGTYSPGTYVINATENQWISVREVAYGRELGPNRIDIPPQGLGVYLISSSTDYAAFGFFKNAPQSINSRRGSIKYAKFVELRAGPFSSR